MAILKIKRPQMKVLGSLGKNTLVRLRAIFMKIHSTRLYERQWVRGLEKVGTDLKELNESTEAGFLAIGDKLQGFYSSAGEISRMSSSVAGLMAGEEIGGAIDGLQAIFERIEKLESGSEASAEKLKQVLGILDEMHEHLAGFEQTARVLRVLCVCTRIESARLGDRDIGFSTLAGDVDKLVEEIESKCTHLMEHSGNLSDLIRRTLANVLIIEAKQQGRARIIRESTLSNLVSLTDRHGSSSTGMQEISTRYKAISRSIGEIVSSLQFHDITRQRMEHAGSAIEALMKEESPTSGSTRRPAGSLHHLRRAGDMCELQAAQFRHARDELVSAVLNIISNLQGIASNVAQIAEETQKMVGAADELGRSFLSELENGFSSINRALCGYSESSNELSSAMGSVGSTLSDMSVYAADIESIGTKIKLIALNAIVKSCHIGDEGAALGVLAEAIHRLSVETCHRTATVCESFKSIIAAAEALTVGIGTQDGGRIEEVDSLSETLKNLLDRLRNLNGSIVSLLTRMDEEGRALSGNIEQTVSSIDVHERVDQVLSGVVAQLEEVVALSHSLAPASDDSDREDQLKELEASYTMEGEREVHKAMVSSAQSGKRAEGIVDISVEAEPVKADEVVDICGSGSDSGGEEDLGDNVELF